MTATQLDFADPVARLSDPDTSHRAASDAKRTASTLRARCLEALKAEDLTDFELADRVNSIQTSAGKRRGELVAAGLVEWAGTTRCSPNRSQARVWRAV